MSLLRFAFELGAELLHEWRKSRAWPQTPAPVRACSRCREVMYTPGLSACTKCGATYP